MGKGAPTVIIDNLPYIPIFYNKTGNKKGNFPRWLLQRM